MSTTAEQALKDATAELAESQRRYDETRAQIDGQSELLANAVAFAFQLGRAQGRAEAALDRIAEMIANHTEDLQDHDPPH